MRLIRLVASALVTIGIMGQSCAAALAQGTPLAPITLAQNVPLLPSLIPTDTTHVNIGREQELFRPGPTYYLFQKLPSRLWFNLSAETSQRYETNVFFKKNNAASDYVYRILPNITLGYDVYKGYSIYANYFVIKDLFAVHQNLSFPTTQSLSWGIRKQKQVGSHGNLQFDFQARELWQTTGVRQFDFLPGITYTHVINPKSVAFLNVILQLRGKDYFVSPTREIDPFYTVGYLRSMGPYVFTSAATLVNNYRHPPFNDAIPPVSNNSIIADFEISRPIFKKYPNLVAFTRAEPIWNWNSHGYPGISGFDFRIFTGLRYTLVKPAYGSQIDKLKQQLQESGVLNGPGVPPTGVPPANIPSSAPTPDAGNSLAPSGTTPAAPSGSGSPTSAPGPSTTAPSPATSPVGLLAPAGSLFPATSVIPATTSPLLAAPTTTTPPAAPSTTPISASGIQPAAI